MSVDWAATQAMLTPQTLAMLGDDGETDTVDDASLPPPWGRLFPLLSTFDTIGARFYFFDCSALLCCTVCTVQLLSLANFFLVLEPYTGSFACAFVFYPKF